MHISLLAAVSPTSTGDDVVLLYEQLYVNESPAFTVRKLGA